MKEPKPVMVIDGKPWWNYLYTYRHDDAEWTFEICATSEADAAERLKRIALARYEGKCDGPGVQLCSPSIYARLLNAKSNLLRVLGLST